MAQYFEDWSGSTAGQFPSGWSEPFAKRSSMWKVVSDGLKNVLEVGETSAGATGRFAISQNASASDPDSQNAEIVFKWKVAGVNQYVPQIGGFCRGSGNQTTTHLYNGGYNRQNDAASPLRLQKYVSGASSSILIGPASFTVQPETWYITRHRVNGTSLMLKIWRAEDSEPASWDITATDSDVSGAGLLGLFTFRCDGAKTTVEWFGAATNGDTAPMSAGGGGTFVAFSGSVANQTGTEGTAFSLNLSTYFSGTETPFAYSVQSGTLPAGLNLNSSTGVISGTPTTAGVSSGIVIRATDATPDTADTNAFSITINEAGAPPDGTPPTLTGSVTFASITQTGYTANWSAGSDNVGVTGYEYQIGSTAGAWTDAGNNLSAAITGRTAGTTETVYVRAYDAAGLRSTPAISGEVTLESALAAGINVTDPLKNNTGTVLSSQSGVRVAVLQAADLVSVYEATGLTTNASGILATISNAAITAGQQYHVAIKLADGSVGITGPITAS